MQLADPAIWHWLCWLYTRATDNTKPLLVNDSGGLAQAHAEGHMLKRRGLSQETVQFDLGPVVGDYSGTQMQGPSYEVEVNCNFDTGNHLTNCDA